MVKRLLWVFSKPTPYNVYLLNELQARLGVPSEALYRWSQTPSHPWTRLPTRRFEWRVAARPGGRDSELERRCGEDDEILPIFAGWRNAIILPALLVRYRRRLPYAFWTDTPKTGRNPLRRMLNAGYVAFARRAVTTLATGIPAMERYLRMGIPRGKVDNFPFVVDPEHFGAAVTLRASRARDVDARFVTPARLIDRLKGQGVALEALRRVRSTAPGKRVVLVLAGVGIDETRLRLRAQDLGLTGAVRFARWVEYADVPALLGTADALVLPSWWDPYPVAVIEAMAAGLPVLGSDACGSVRERVVDGENGFVHRTGDAAALAQHMLTMVVSAETRLRMGRAALLTSRAWGIDHCVHVLRDVLTRVPQAARSTART